MATDGPPRTTTFRLQWERLKALPLSRVGPGLITGAADDDPSGIATYSQAVRNSASTCCGRCHSPFL